MRWQAYSGSTSGALRTSAMALGNGSAGGEVTDAPRPHRVGVDANDFVDTERPRQLDVRALAAAATLADDRAGAIRDRDGRAIDESLHRP